MKKTILFTIINFLSLLSYAQDLQEFNIKSAVQFKGSVSAMAGFASTSNGIDRTSPNFYSLSSRMSLSWNEFRLPFYFSLRNHSYNYGATAPRFRINPRYKWAEVQVGDVFTRFNSYTLAQRNMRGLALKLNPGKFRFQAIYGKMQELNTFRDSLMLGVTDDQVFSNRVLGMGIGVGSRTSYIDLYVLKAWTDEDEALFTEAEYPRQDNVVVGSTAKLRIAKRIYLQYNLGISALTFDRDAIGDTEEIGKNGFTGSLLDVNGTTSLNYAGDVSIRYSKGTFGLNGKVAYIQAFYQPLTVAYINSDVLNYTAGGYLSLWKNKLYLNANVGIQQNNITDIDRYTTNRLIFSLLSNVRLTNHITANIALNNFSQTLDARLININDTYTYAVDNRVLSGSLTHSISGDTRSYSNRISIGRTNFSTSADNQEATQTYDMNFARYDGEITLEPWGLGINLGLNYQLYNREGAKNSNYGLTAGLTKHFLEKQLSFALNNTFNYIDQEGFRSGNSLMNNLSARYNIAKKSALLLSLIRINRTSVISNDFSDVRGRISFNQKF